MTHGTWMFSLAFCGLGLLGNSASLAGEAIPPAPKSSKTDVFAVAYLSQDNEPSPFKVESEAAPVPDPAYAAPPAPRGGSDVGEACAECYSAPTCKSCQSGSRFCNCGKLADPWKLPQPRALACRDIQIGGWVEAGLYSNAYGDSSNGPLGFNNVAGGAVNQLWVYGERKTKTDGYGVDWGFRTDYVFGTDGPDTQAFGDRSWDYGWNSSRDYGSAIPQFYSDLAINDLTIRMGRFFTPIGSEVIPAVNNFFYSHTYEMFYGEPFTHTGAVAMYKFSDKLTGMAGWTDGWDGGFKNNNHASTFLGGLSVNPSDKATVAWYCTFGTFGNGSYSGNAGDIYMNSFVLTYKLTDRWTYLFQNDIGVNYNLPGGATHWYGINQNLIYKISDCTSMGGRLEWFDDVNGARVTGDGLGRTIGNPGSYWEMTYGVNYKPHANVTLRPEVRYDWFNGRVANERPFNRGNSTDQFSGGFDVIFTF